MELKNKKKIIAIILIVVIVIISGITYGYWNKEYIGKENTNNFNCLNITKLSETSGITLNNAYPITDEEGINDKNNMYEVQIKNTCNLMVQYNVIANVINSSNLEESHVKIGSKKTTEEEYAINLLSNYEETTPTVEEVKKARVIKRGYLKKDETTTISIKEWMDYETTKEEGENKKFISKITIEGINGENTLGGKILANNEVIEKEPDFKKGEPPESGTNTGSGLYKTEDDDGESYYFRGAVENNYVKFGRGSTEGNKEEHDLLWRIVRINGDGNVRLILSENIAFSVFNDEATDRKHVGFTYDNDVSCTQEHSCEVTYDSNNNSFNNENFGGQNSTIKTKLETWYINNLKDVNDKIALEYYCNDTSHGGWTGPTYLFSPYIRVVSNNASLKCLNPKDDNGNIVNYGGIYKTKIGLLTVDELEYAGLVYFNKGIYNTNSNYLSSLPAFWAMSPGHDLGYVLYSNLTLIGNNHIVDYSHNIIPVINLKLDVQVTGQGTKEEPYQVRES